MVVKLVTKITAVATIALSFNVMVTISYILEIEFGCFSVITDFIADLEVKVIFLCAADAITVVNSEAAPLLLDRLSEISHTAFNVLSLVATSNVD